MILYSIIQINQLQSGGYPPTKLEYFKPAGTTGESTIIWGEGTMPGLAVTVDECYSFFRSIAMIVYMIMH